MGFKLSATSLYTQEGDSLLLKLGHDYVQSYGCLYPHAAFSSAGLRAGVRTQFFLKSLSLKSFV
jgi:hypothetical protein